MTADGEVLVPPFGLLMMQRYLIPFFQSKSDTLIGLESTSHYGENLFAIFIKLNYLIALCLLKI